MLGILREGSDYKKLKEIWRYLHFWKNLCHCNCAGKVSREMLQKLCPVVLIEQLFVTTTILVSTELHLLFIISEIEDKIHLHSTSHFLNLMKLPHSS